ncbi:MAG: hypothetical protein ACLPXT_09240 [Terracidiphilus sp.]
MVPCFRREGDSVTKLRVLSTHLGDSIVQVHAQDNHGTMDEHLFPGDGAIDWPVAVTSLNALATPPAIILELSSKLVGDPASLANRIRQAFALLH